MKAGALTGCHQMYERSFRLRGYQFPVCARCTGLAAGQLFGLIFFFIYSKWDYKILFSLGAASVLILGIDGFGQLYQHWTSNNARRFVTGISCGFFIMSIFMKLVFL